MIFRFLQRIVNVVKERSNPKAITGHSPKDVETQSPLNSKFTVKFDEKSVPSTSLNEFSKLDFSSKNEITLEGRLHIAKQDAIQAATDTSVTLRRQQSDAHFSPKIGLTAKPLSNERESDVAHRLQIQVKPFEKDSFKRPVTVEDTDKEAKSMSVIEGDSFRVNACKDVKIGRYEHLKKNTEEIVMKEDNTERCSANVVFETDLAKSLEGYFEIQRNSLVDSNKDNSLTNNSAESDSFSAKTTTNCILKWEETKHTDGAPEVSSNKEGNVIVKNKTRKETAAKVFELSSSKHAVNASVVNIEPKKRGRPPKKPIDATETAVATEKKKSKRSHNNGQTSEANTTVLKAKPKVKGGSMSVHLDVMPKACKKSTAKTKLINMKKL